ncbi:MAG TPA: glycosyltransferase family 4 protein [Solirubrobacteraceae bacterium]|nr:glycosyltransferase family 4 protein [Solirubrobacteraceae bacterium]
MNHTSVIGGAEYALLEHLRIMPSQREAGPVLCPPGELADALAHRGIEVLLFRGTTVSFRFTIRSLTRGAVEFVSSVRAIRRAGREAGCAVVHANSIRAGLLACCAGMVGGPPVVVHVHDVLPSGPVSRLVRSLLMRRAAALVAVSEFTRASFVSGLRSSRTPFPVIHNPVDIEGLMAQAPERAVAREKLGLPSLAPVLGIVGQITPWKGHETVIMAMPKVLEVFPEAQLLIVGEPRFVGPSTRYDNRAYSAGLQAMVEDLGVSHAVRFLGHRDDVPAVMRALDLLLLPSSVEPLARVALEAMVLGTPMLATVVGGLPEVIDEGRTGFLAPPGDVAAWTERILELLQDRTRLSEVGEQARTAIVGRVASERYVEQMSSLYAQVRSTRSCRSRRSVTVDAANPPSPDARPSESISTSASLAGQATEQ